MAEYDPYKARPLTPLNICGFTFTGKTAVADFFRDLDCTYRWPGTEGQLNRFPGGFFHIWQSLLAHKKIPQKDLESAESLLKGTFTFEPDQEWAYLPTDTRKWLNEGMEIVHAQTQNRLLPLIESYLAALRPLSIEGKMPFPAMALMALGAFNEFYYASEEIVLAATGNTMTVWDNLYHPFNYAHRNIFNKINTLVVERDPRDQYIDAVKDPDFIDKYKDIDKFVNFHKSFRRQFIGAGGFGPDSIGKLSANGFITKRVDNGLLIYVSFEAFVSREDIRLEICNLLGVDGAALREESKRRFAAEKSVMNVGKFRTNRDFDSELKLIEQALPDYLIQSERI